VRYSPRNIEISFSHAGLTHYGGILFFNEFSRVLQLRRFVTFIRRRMDEILHRIHRLSPWRVEATFAEIERLMQAFWRRRLDFRPLLKEKSEIHDGSRYSSPSAICLAIGSASSGASGPCLMRSASVGPCASSITNPSTPFDSSTP
jgi:hypothetical protein